MMEHLDFATGRLTVTDTIYNQLLVDISDGVYKVGEKLPSESALCKEHKASRVSVRSALQRLAAIGLIGTYQGRGSYVISNEVKSVSEETKAIDGESTDERLSMEAYKEFWQFRQLLGDKAHELFAINAKEEDYDCLRKIIDKMIDTNDAEEIVRLSVDFHMYIYQHCGNRYIENALGSNKETMIKAARMIQKENYQPKSAQIRLDERMIELLRAKDTKPIMVTIAEENLKYIHGIHNKPEQ